MEGLAEYLGKEYADISGRAIVKAMSLSLQKKARISFPSQFTLIPALRPSLAAARARVWVPSSS